MQNPLNITEVRKILLVFGILLLLVFVVLYVRQVKQRILSSKLKRPSSQNTLSVTPTVTSFPLSGSYSLEPSVKTLKSGEKVSVQVVFVASGKRLDGADIILVFDPLYFEADPNLELTNFFTSFPRKTVDNKIGKIKVTAFQAKSQEPLSNPVTLLTVSFLAKKPGKTTINFDFQKGKTNTTTLVEHGTSRNILAGVVPVSLEITP